MTTTGFRVWLMQKWVFTIPLPVLYPEKGEMYRGKNIILMGGGGLRGG
jgi:hypothetical protein